MGSAEDDSVNNMHFENSTFVEIAIVNINTFTFLIKVTSIIVTFLVIKSCIC